MKPIMIDGKPDTYIRVVEAFREIREAVEERRKARNRRKRRRAK